MQTLSMTVTGLIFLATACGGIPREQKVAASLDNQSDYPAVLTLELSSSSAEDGCKPDTSSRQRTIEVAPHTQESGTLTWSCSYDVNPQVRFNLNRGIGPGKPAAKWVAYGIGGHLVASLAPGETIYWLDDEGVSHAATISEEQFYDMAQSKEMPDTEALLREPVRTDGRVLEMFFKPEENVTALGVPTDRFKPVAPNDLVNRYAIERNGVNFFKVYGHGVSGALSGDSQKSSAHVVCKNDGCFFE